MSRVRAIAFTPAWLVIGCCALFLAVLSYGLGLIGAPHQNQMVVLDE